MIVKTHNMEAIVYCHNQMMCNAVGFIADKYSTNNFVNFDPAVTPIFQIPVDLKSASNLLFWIENKKFASA